jgi:hypothetical protein
MQAAPVICSQLPNSKNILNVVREQKHNKKLQEKNVHCMSTMWNVDVVFFVNAKSFLFCLVLISWGLCYHVQTRVFFSQFCDVPTQAIIHKRNYTNLATGQRGK